MSPEPPNSDIISLKRFLVKLFILISPLIACGKDLNFSELVKADFQERKEYAEMQIRQKPENHPFQNGRCFFFGENGYEIYSESSTGVIMDNRS